VPISEEEARKEIEALFKSFLTPVEEEKIQEVAEDIELTEEHLQAARQKLLEDIEALREALVKFQQKTAGLSVFYYMESALNHYISKAIELEAMAKGLKTSHIFREKNSRELEENREKLIALLEDIYNNFIK